MKSHERAHQPVALADQLVAWLLYRQGWGTTDIAYTMRRLPTEARAILWGDPKIAHLTRRAA